MARSKREFVESDDLKDIAEKLLGKYQGVFFGLLDPDNIKFALITSEKAKNSKPLCVEENAKDWILEETRKFALVAVYEEDWVTWSQERKEWEVLEGLMNLPIGADGKKHKPDLQDYKFRIDYLGVNWREKNNKGSALPGLLDVKDPKVFDGVVTEYSPPAGTDAEDLEFPEE
jgi:hypothetical protein